MLPLFLLRTRDDRLRCGRTKMCDGMEGPLWIHYRNNRINLRFEPTLKNVCVNCGTIGLDDYPDNWVCEPCSRTLVQANPDLVVALVTWHNDHCWYCYSPLDSRDPLTPRCSGCGWCKCDVCPACSKYGCPAPWSLRAAKGLEDFESQMIQLKAQRRIVDARRAKLYEELKSVFDKTVGGSL